MIKAVSDKIFVSILKREKTAGGIVLPTTAVDPQSYGKVLSVGEDVKHVSVGNCLVFHNRGGMDIAINNKLYKILKEDEVYGILTDEALITTLGETELERK